MSIERDEILIMNFNSYLRKFLVKPYLMNISTLMRGQLHQNQLLIQQTQIGDLNAEEKHCNQQKLVLQSADTVLINDSGDEIADDKQEVRKVTASNALESLEIVNCFTEIHGEKQTSTMLNESIAKVKTIKLQNVTQSTIHVIFMKRNLTYHN